MFNWLLLMSNIMSDDGKPDIIVYPDAEPDLYFFIGIIVGIVFSLFVAFIIKLICDAKKNKKENKKNDEEE